MSRFGVRLTEKIGASRRCSGIPRSFTRELRLRLSICGNWPASSFSGQIGKSTVGDAVIRGRCSSLASRFRNSPQSPAQLLGSCCGKVVY